MALNRFVGYADGQYVKPSNLPPLSATIDAAQASMNSQAALALQEDANANLDKPGVDCAAMMAFWDLTDTIVEGANAIKAASTRYLPQFPHEESENYQFRLQQSKFTNVYRDVLENLASKPFEEEIKLPTDNTAPSQIIEFLDDVDGAKTSITNFAGLTFFNGINSAIDWIFVDFTKAISDHVLTQAEEKTLGLKPFWTHVRARNVLEVRTQIINGNRELTYFRLLEPAPDGSTFVRIFERDAVTMLVTWTLWKKVPRQTNPGMMTFVQVDDGVITIGAIPMVPFITGRQNGSTWQFSPPMRDAADLQVELYQAESGLKHAKTMTAYPMLAGNGVSPEKDAAGNVKPLKTGPGVALYAPIHAATGHAGSWQMLEPSAQSLTFLQSDVDKTINQLRELGRNPLTAQSGNLTVITTAVASKKGNSAAKLWAGLLKNALENALNLTALWFGIADYKAQVNVYDEFDVLDDLGTTDVADLINMRDKGMISQDQFWTELGRRGFLSPEFDAEKERGLLLDDTAQADKLAAMLPPPTQQQLPPPAKPPAA